MPLSDLWDVCYNQDVEGVIAYLESGEHPTPEDNNINRPMMIKGQRYGPPLSYAVSKMNNALVTALLAHGADPNIRFELSGFSAFT